jgi:hypothetical protein
MFFPLNSMISNVLSRSKDYLYFTLSTENFRESIDLSLYNEYTDISDSSSSKIPMSVDDNLGSKFLFIYFRCVNAFDLFLLIKCMIDS